MLMKKTYISALLASLALITLSCSEDESTASYPSLSGLTITKPVPYYSLGETLVFEADRSRLTVSEGTMPVVGLAWQANNSKRDTLTQNVSLSNPSYTVKLDSLGSYTVTCTAFAGSEYYSTSASVSFEVIDPATALTGISGSTTVLDGVTYFTTVVGGKTWMASNMAKSGSGIAYKGAEVSSLPLGRYYTWEEASAVCPSGWHLPSAAEWDTLGEDAGDLMADAIFLEDKMWEYWPAVNITNSTGFNAIPVGYADKSFDSASFSGLGNYSAFWTADSSGEMASYRYIVAGEPKIKKGQGSKSTLAMSVRCVKD